MRLCARPWSRLRSRLSPPDKPAPGRRPRRPAESRGNGKRVLAQRARVVCSEPCALALRDRLVTAGELTREAVASGQVQVGPDPFGNHMLVLLEDPAQPVIFSGEYLSGEATRCGVCGSPCAAAPNLSGRELRIPTAAGEALRERVLGLTVLQLRSVAELLSFYVETIEPRPESNESPPTEMQAICLDVRMAHEAVARRLEDDLEARQEFHRSGSSPDKPRGEGRWEC